MFGPNRPQRGVLLDNDGLPLPRPRHRSPQPQCDDELADDLLDEFDAYWSDRLTDYEAEIDHLEPGELKNVRTP